MLMKSKGRLSYKKDYKPSEKWKLRIKIRKKDVDAKAAVEAEVEEIPLNVPKEEDTNILILLQNPDHILDADQDPEAIVI